MMNPEYSEEDLNSLFESLASPDERLEPLGISERQMIHYVAGLLAPEEASMVEQALAQNPELERDVLAARAVTTGEPEPVIPAPPWVATLVTTVSQAFERAGQNIEFWINKVNALMIPSQEFAHALRGAGAKAPFEESEFVQTSQETADGQLIVRITFNDGEWCEKLVKLVAGKWSSEPVDVRNLGKPTATILLSTEDRDRISRETFVLLVPAPKNSA